jgi:uncharacterized protein
MALAGGGAASGAAGSSGMPPAILAIFERVGTGGLKDSFLGNLVLLLGRWADLIATMRFPKVLGMFVLGVWLVRRGIALAPQAHRPLLVRWAALGWGVGLPLNIAAAWSMEHWPYLPPSAGGLLGVIAGAIGIPLLALGYAATIALLVVDGVRIVRIFAPMGRMALTNYLLQSVICVSLASGWGAGLWWRIGASRAMLIAAMVVSVQLALSALWLSRTDSGPAERLWRRLARIPR